MNAPRLLVVEDDAALAEALCSTLEVSGYRTRRASDGEQALALLDQETPDLLLTDMQMKPMDGYGLLRELRDRRQPFPVLVMTAHGTVEKAVEAMKLGAVDYLTKPFEAEILLDKVAHHLPAIATQPPADFIAEDERSQQLVEVALRVARSDATVLISGESGTGKEVLARLLHSHSLRATGPFVAINCAAIPDNMLEAVLFGYEKGAYTGAIKSSAGKFEQAQGGTLLLDEISEMSLPLQAKLLRVLQEREVERLGGKQIIELDVRVLATTNRRLREEVAAGRFREDLFYRLNVFPLVQPALRERRRDILPLARFLLQRHAGGVAVPELSPAAEGRLLSHDWPGNVRELENVVQRALILSSGDGIEAGDLQFEPAAGDDGESAASDEAGGNRLSEDLRSVEEQMILDALHSGGGSRKRAAEILGISPRTLRYKIARLREAGVSIP